PEAMDEGRIADVVTRQREGDRDHVELEHRHPAGAVALLERAAGRQRPIAIEDADVVEAEEAAAEDAGAFAVLAVHPPAEHQHEAVERRREKLAIAGAAVLPLEVIQLPRRPRQDRWIDRVEVPLERRHRAVRVLRAWMQQQEQLLL